ncbi:hypothetical protein Tco_0139093 [Tanacetum coccineum]
MSNFMASQDAKISKFEANFKQYQSEVTNKLDAFLKAFNDQMTGVLLSDTDQLQVNTLTANEIETPTTREPENILGYEFADLHLNLLVLEVLTHVPIYDALLDKCIVSLGLGKNGSEYIQSVSPEKMKDLRLFILPLGRGFLATSNSVIYCKKAKIVVGEGLTRSIFGVRELDFGEDNVPYWTTIGKCESYRPRTSKDGISARPPYYAKRDCWDNHWPEE